MSKFANTAQPTNAPRAPASFQSPAPRLRRKTKGKSSSSPSPAPSREALSPNHPLASAFTETPIKSPGTVSQFGIRRLRQSVYPPISAKATASPSTIGFKPPPACSGRAVAEPQCAKAPAKDSPRTTLDAPKRRLEAPLARIFTQSDAEVNEDRGLRPPAKSKGPERIRASRKSCSSYRLRAPAPLCSATMRLALSARALACGRRSRPFRISGSDSARTFMPSS